MEEIGQVNQAHAELVKEKPGIEPLFLDAERKNKLLNSVAGGGVEQLGQFKTRWDKFEIMMESHQLMIKDQVYLRVGFPRHLLYPPHRDVLLFCFLFSFSPV